MKSLFVLLLFCTLPLVAQTNANVASGSSLTVRGTVSVPDSSRIATNAKIGLFTRQQMIAYSDSVLLARVCLAPADTVRAFNNGLTKGINTPAESVIEQMPNGTIHEYIPKP